MADIRAATEAMATEAQRLSALGPFMYAAAGAVGTTADAADESEAAGACAQLVNVVAGAVAGFGEVEARLANAVALAAECYALTDQNAMPERAAQP
jgi:hypothetical protein